MNKTKFLKIVILSIAIRWSQYAFAIPEEYKTMETKDQIKLQKICDFMDSEDAKVTPVKSADKFMKFVQEIKAKYPKLEFSNPCGLS